TAGVVSWVYANQKKTPFEQYLNAVKNRALKAGVSQKTINKYLSNIAPPRKGKEPIVIYHQRHQAAATETFEVYKKRFIPAIHLTYARKQFKRNYILLKRVEEQYHVQPAIIVALWGIESNYGRDIGEFPLIRSLAVLGFHRHRSA